MDIDVSAEAKDKNLNKMVAITVVFLSVFMGVCGIKDGNVVQAMQQAQAMSVDKWNEYQAARTKLHIVEAARTQIALLAVDPAKAAPVLASYDAEIAKYRTKTPQLAADAKAQAALYDALNVHDDQFDASDAAISTAISIAAVAALSESGWLLGVSWVFGGFGVFMGLCGFMGWGFHPDILSGLLG
jgi:cell wall-associated NlpC family hydrolase